MRCLINGKVLGMQKIERTVTNKFIINRVKNSM